MISLPNPNFKLESDTSFRGALLQFSLLIAGKFPRKLCKPIFRAVCGLSRSIAHPTDCTTVRLSKDSLFSFPVGFWTGSRMVFTRREYEPDLAKLFRCLATSEFSFLDCGANIGYWSVMLSGMDFGNHPTIAIEIAGESFRILERNSFINNSRFICLKRAVHSSSDESLSIFGVDSGDLTVAPRNKHEALLFTGEEVLTITLDHCSKMFAQPSTLNFVVKLDVEGAELAAIEGAHSLLQKNTMLIFEENSKSPEKPVTRHLQENLGMDVYALLSDTPPQKLASWIELREAHFKGVKNLVAVRPGSEWSTLMSRISGGEW